MSHAKGTYIYDGVQTPWTRGRDVVVLVIQLARRHLAIRYHGSKLGPLWTLLNPLLMMIVYGFLFSVVIKAQVPGVPFPAYFLAGYLAWNVIALSVGNNVGVVLECKGLIDSHKFPNWTLPVSRVAAAFFNFLVVLPLLLIMNVIFGIMPGWGLLIFPLASVLLFMFATGIGLLISATTPFFRDLQQLVEVSLTILYFASPILYPFDLVDGHFATKGWPILDWLYLANPITGIIELMHASLVEMEVPVVSFFSATIGSTLILVLGILHFRRTSPDFNAVI